MQESLFHPNTTKYDVLQKQEHVVRIEQCIFNALFCLILHANRLSNVYICNPLF